MGEGEEEMGAIDRSRTMGRWVANRMGRGKRCSSHIVSSYTTS